MSLLSPVSLLTEPNFLYSSLCLNLLWKSFEFCEINFFSQFSHSNFKAP